MNNENKRNDCGTLNIEKYYDDIVKYKNNFAVNKTTGEGGKCRKAIKCKDCIFFESDKTCEAQLFDWFFKKYRESLLNDNEKSTIKALVEWCIATYEVDKSNLAVIKEYSNSNTISIVASLYRDAYQLLIASAIDVEPFRYDDFENLEVDRYYSLEELGL